MRVLRTVIREEGGKSYQEIGSPDRWQMAHCDRSAESLELQISEMIGIPFNLSEDYPLRVQMLRLSSSEYILVWVVHHIAADAWSWGILTRELSQFYQAYIRGEAISLPELGVQYADYSLWQRSYYQGEVLSQQLSYWTEHLSGLALWSFPQTMSVPPFRAPMGSECIGS